MDIFFQDPSEVPLPPAEVRIRELTARPYDDGRRLRVTLEVEPYQKRPSVDLMVIGPAGQTSAVTNIIELFPRRVELTMHLRGATPPGDYRLSATLYYVELPPAPAPGQPAPAELPDLPEPNVVDQTEVQFTLSGAPTE